jgi:tripartite-type tricarboxylate transporter receptor subunit TctC
MGSKQKMRCQRKPALLLLIAAAAISACPGQVIAQTYPDHPIRLIIPFAAGGAPDFMARPVAAQVESQIGQPIVVENRSGANGIVGMQAVAGAEPNGYTLLHVVPAFVINPSVYKKLPFDIFQDYAAVATLGIGSGYLLLVNPKVPANTVAELIAYAKTQRVLYGSAGIGNTLHLTAELFNAKAGIAMEHVPFRGAAPVLHALLAGTVDVAFVTPAAVLDHVQSGALRAIGFTGGHRLRELPQVPLIQETVADFKVEGAWHGWLAPAKTPQGAIGKLNLEVQQALKEPKVAQAIIQAGYEPKHMSPQEFGAFLRDEAARYAEAVRAAKIEPQ